MISEAFEWPVAAALAVLTALVCRATLAQPSARFWGAWAAIGLTAGATRLVSTDALAACALAAGSILVGVKKDRPSTAIAALLALCAVAIDAPIGIAAVGLVSWRARTRWQLVAEPLLALGVIRILSTTPLVPAAMVLGGAMLAGGLVARSLRPAHAPPRASTIAPTIQFGMALGIFGLLIADDRVGLVPRDAIWMGFALSVPAALAGACVAIAYFGARTLLALRDEARVVLIALAVGSAIIAALSLRSAGIILIIPATLALAAGAARAQTWVVALRS